MALSDPQDTLAYHQSRVLTQHRNMTHVSCSDVAKKVSVFMSLDKAANTVPEQEALWFYGMNHGMALIASHRAPYEPLSQEELDFVRTYHKVLGPKAVRAFYYLLLICVRESRHVHATAAFDKDLQKKFGAAALMFNKAIRGAGSTGAYQKFLSAPPASQLGPFVKSLAWNFYNGKFSGGYGGPAWGKVADCLVRFVTGEFTAEMMLDTVWTLAHNNGPIFNKGMLYGGYGPYLLRILDVQRSGQMPEAILTDNAIMSFSTNELSQHMAWLQKRFPDKIGSYVDWYVVEALGAVGHYAGEKKKQVTQHGMSQKASEAEKAKAAAEAAKVAAEAKAKEEYLKTHFEVMPGLVIKKIEPKHRQAA